MKKVLYNAGCKYCRGFVKKANKLNQDPKLSFVDYNKVEKDFLKEKNLPLDPTKDLVYIDGETPYTKSTAGLMMMRDLKFPYNTLYPLIIVPKPIRDIGYEIMSTYKYRLFAPADKDEVPDDNTVPKK